MADRQIDAEALDWVIRQGAADFDAWEAFESWLVANPAHPAAYAEVALADQDLAAVLANAPSPTPLFAAQPLPSRRLPPGRWFGGAVAAAVVTVAGVSAWQQRADRYTIETPAGVPREMLLADGSRLQINGSTRLVLDRNNVRDVQIVRGEVAFAVVHDAARPFRVEVADATLLDLGTEFDVISQPGVLRVAVAQGAVMFNPEGEAVQLNAGRALVSRAGTGRIELADVSPAAVGAWRAGRLVYNGAPLADVASDLSRNLGVPIEVDRRVAGQAFRGVINLASGSASVARLGPLLGVTVTAEGRGWRLSAPAP